MRWVKQRGKRKRKERKGKERKNINKGNKKITLTLLILPHKSGGEKKGGRG
jgi:hypothetical protein